MRTVGAVLRRRTTTTSVSTITRRYIPSAIVIILPLFFFYPKPSKSYPQQVCKTDTSTTPVDKQIAKTKAIRAAYLRRMDGGADAGVPEGGKAGDAKSIGVLSK